MASADFSPWHAPVRLLLIRHGRVDFDSTEFLQTARGRQWDPPLDETGIEQVARLTARLLLLEQPVRIATSPFRRCRETVGPYVHAAGLEAEVVDDLGEVFIGDWEGVRFEEIMSEDEELAKRFRDQEPVFGMAPGGETGQTLRRRVVPAVERLLEGVTAGEVVVVTHGGVINAYLGHVMDLRHDMFFLPENSSINAVGVDGSNRGMRFLNDVRHLTEPSLFAPPVPRQR